MNILLQILCFIFLIYISKAEKIVKTPPINLSHKSKDKSESLPPCKSCTVFVESFKKGMEKTIRGKHEGGDASWEAENLRSYKNSEIRLVEIQETLCNDVTRGQDQCHTLANDNEHHIEDWWFKEQNKNPDLFQWLCIDRLKVCCLPGHFGVNCDKCSDCNGNGKCKGNGTRKGNGKCACDPGYSGEFCNECAQQYYESYKDEKTLLCSSCYMACGDGKCTGPGPKGCLKCKRGWSMDSELGCFDINECVDSPSACTSNQFCVNNEGSYTCLDCDRSCVGCIGDGPDMCKKCADGYELRDGKCTDLTSEKRDQFVSFTRFLTYMGLCIATCAIFQSSSHIAYIVGAAVAIYIAASEYWLNTNPSSVTPQFDTKQIEDIIKNSL